ncbi:uncharacterized protein LOC107425472 isoform X1 [Ziziphus jujuba]|uniref:Uncharacterized protein LOC107425472 isoform X1 n=1 Tax=Ziziphus jujuba TaxID=326968 RepID=A0ABM3ITP9_ZIZJJ|nr:uncharacterized protein LOC107425472 isoform X1 [Ziziphus jujuba]
MSCNLKLQVTSCAIKRARTNAVAGYSKLHRRPYDLKLPYSRRRPRSLSVQSEYVGAESSIPPSHYTETVGTPSLSSSSLRLSQWNLTDRHVVLLNVIACAAAISATCLFCSAIPALLAFKRAAESMEKLMDAVREELPGTMAAVRLSGMEISDLTMELSDLGQGITQGVKSSTRAVRVAEERLHRLANMGSPASLQEIANRENEVEEPVVAKTARGIKNGIVKGRSIWKMFFTLTRFSRMALNYFSSRSKR